MKDSQLLLWHKRLELYDFVENLVLMAHPQEPICMLRFANVTIGNWKGSVPIPDQSFEIREQWLHGEDRALFVQFLRRMLCWMPEERPVAEELAFDEFLMQPHATAFSETSTETLT